MRIPAVLTIVGVLMSTPLQAGPCGVYTRPAYQSYQVQVATPYVVAQKVEIVPDFFYSSRDYYRDEAAAKQAEALAEAIKLLRENGRYPAAPAAARSDGLDLPPLDGGLSASQPVGNVQLQQIVQGACVKCHAGTSNRNHTILTNLGSLTASQRADVYEEVASGRMPPSGSLTKEQVRVFRDFAR